MARQVVQGLEQVAEKDVARTRNVPVIPFSRRAYVDDRSVIGLGENSRIDSLDPIQRMPIGAPTVNDIFAGPSDDAIETDERQLANQVSRSLFTAGNQYQIALRRQQ